MRKGLKGDNSYRCRMRLVEQILINNDKVIECIQTLHERVLLLERRIGELEEDLSHDLICAPNCGHGSHVNIENLQLL